MVKAWAMALAWVAMEAARAAGPSVELGRRLYLGELALAGTIQGHAQPLPPAAARCGNCHSRGSAERAASGADSFAPLLTRERLTGSIARRGGPPSRYDAALFCRLLRSGIDPAVMLIPRQMPRYQIDDAQCAALWAYLVEDGGAR